MDDLFRRAKKYSMLEDDVHAATQQILVTGQSAKNDEIRNPKAMSQRRQPSKGLGEQRQPDQSNLTPLNVSYEKLLPMIHEISVFRWPEPLKMVPTKRDYNRRCACHKEHGHTTKQCRSLHYLVEKLIKAGYLKQYVRSGVKYRETSQSPVTAFPTAVAAPRVVINYIHGGPINKEYSSK